jgi:hypothetical protein
LFQAYANRLAEEKQFSPDAFMFPGRSDNTIGHIHRATAARRLKALFVDALGEEAAKGISSHSLRRTLATSLYLMGERIEVIQRILGHKHLETTLRYIEISKNQLVRTQLQLHRERGDQWKRAHVKGRWRSSGPRSVQFRLFGPEVGYADLDNVSCTNAEAEAALIASSLARGRSTRCKPKRPRPRRRLTFGCSSE